jgi:hypothetical protein
LRRGRKRLGCAMRKQEVPSAAPAASVLALSPLSGDLHQHSGDIHSVEAARFWFWHAVLRSKVVGGGGLVSGTESNLKLSPLRFDQAVRAHSPPNFLVADEVAWRGAASGRLVPSNAVGRGEQRAPTRLFPGPRGGVRGHEKLVPAPERSVMTSILPGGRGQHADTSTKADAACGTAGPRSPKQTRTGPRSPAFCSCFGPSASTSPSGRRPHELHHATARGAATVDANSFSITLGMLLCGWP